MDNCIKGIFKQLDICTIVDAFQVESRLLGTWLRDSTLGYNDILFTAREDEKSSSL